LRVAQDRIDLGAAKCLDAAAGIDFVDRESGAEPALLAGEERAPETGCSTPTLTAAPWARSTAAADNSPAAAVAPSAVVCKNRRRFTFDD